MPDILPLLLSLSPVLSQTTCRQLHRLVLAMLSMTGRVTQLGLSRYGGKGGSYRSVQRFFHTPIDWLQVQWLFLQRSLGTEESVYLLVGDETPVRKAGKHTHGLDAFYSSVAGKAIAGLGFFSLALLDVKKRHAYSLSTQQIVRSEAEKEQAQARKAQAKERKAPRGKRVGKSAPPSLPKRPVGRPKGSKNKNKADVVLSAELQRILGQAQTALSLVQKRLRVGYFVLDGHFGHPAALAMTRQLDLHLISKLHHNAELYLLPTQEEQAAHPRRKYGARVDYAHLPEGLRCCSVTEGGYCTEIYQATCRHKRFGAPLNIVIVVKTHLPSQRVGHVVLFSSDLTLQAACLLDYYGLRFQIEFTFRDAKQYFGLEDFMGVGENSVANAVGLAFFLQTLSQELLVPLRAAYPGAGIHDLKAYYRACFYLQEFQQYVPEKATSISWSPLLEHICSRAFIHPKPKREPQREKAA